MKRYIITVFVCLGILVTFVSCKDTVPRLEMAVCGSYGVPGMICYDLKGGKFDCEILEEDSHGRILYEYTTKNVITDKEETTLVICQMFDSEYVYFYEDKCYLLPGYENSEIDTLKEQNDWNEALDQSKMSRREINISFDLVLITDSEIETNSVRSVCRKKLGINDKQLEELCVLDTDHNGHELYWLCVLSNESEAHYLVVASTGYAVSIFPLEDGVMDSAAIAEFKRESGWIYGFTE